MSHNPEIPALPFLSVILAMMCFNSMARVSKKAHLIATVILCTIFAYYFNTAWQGAIHGRFEDQIRVGAAAVVFTISGWTIVSLGFNPKTWEEPIWPKRPVVEAKSVEVLDEKVDSSAEV